MRKYRLCSFILASLGCFSVYAQDFSPVKKELAAMVSSTEEFLRKNKSADGVTPEPRSNNFPTEQIRLNIVPQALGYLELYRATKKDLYLQEAIDRGNHLVRNIEVRRRNAYDGMLAYALFCLFETTQNPVYLMHAEDIIRDMMNLPLPEMRRNTGLMAAMGLAKSYQLSSNQTTLQRLKDVINLLATDQNSDGSFPHAYDGVDLHYSSWMAMQLIIIQQSLKQNEVPLITHILKELHLFMKKRIDLKTGQPTYQEEICNNGNCNTVYYYAKVTASQPEYDTRGWINELGYEIYTGIQFKDLEQVSALTRFLKTLQSSEKAFPDKWDYPIDPQREPDQYPWSIGKHSVVRTSLIFWELAASLNL